ncbi:MAG: hypothetical protein KAH25_12315, partial [Bacteroidales bacterium]|nr:hypothetical protein [Bacteroidales bacterium]
NNYYIFILKEPKDKITLNHLKADIGSQVCLLGTEIFLDWKWEDDKMTIYLPKELRKNWTNSSYAWVIKITGEELMP